jgi:flagellar biosynthesis protein FlhG
MPKSECRTKLECRMSNDQGERVMIDQADRLRALVRESGASEAAPRAGTPRKLVVCGGKGGVGTTTLAVNLGVAIARHGVSTVLADVDMNRADVANLCGLEARECIGDVLAGNRTIHEVLHRGPAGIQVLPGSWSPRSVPDCSSPAQERLLRELDRLGRHAEVVVLDAGSGLNHVVKRYWKAADAVLLITTPENTAIMDSYAAIKVFAKSPAASSVHVFVNCADEATGQGVFERLQRACQHFLGIEIEHAGQMPRDRIVAESAVARRPFAVESTSDAAMLIDALAQRLLASLSSQDACDPSDSEPQAAAAAA